MIFRFKSRAILFAILFNFFSVSLLVSQAYIEALHSFYDDSYIEWDIFSPEHEGKISMTWPSRQDLTEWGYEIGEKSGIIQTVWSKDLTKWELRSYDGESIEFYMKWRDDKTEWVIRNGNYQISYRSKYTSDLNLWEVTTKKYGKFEMKTEYDDDPRDWIIEDYISDKLPIEFAVICSFITLYVCSTL